MSGGKPSVTHIGGGNGAAGVGGTAFGAVGIGGGTAFGAPGGRGVAVAPGTGNPGGAGGATAGAGVGIIGGVTAAGGTGGVAQYHSRSLRCNRCAISMRSDRAGFTHRLAG